MIPQDTTPPTFAVPPASQTVACDGLGNTQQLLDWVASNGGAVVNDSCGTITLSNDFNSSYATQALSRCGATGALSVTFTATDACGNAANASAVFTIVV